MMQLSSRNRTFSCRLREMNRDDVAQVTAIDRVVFPTMIPAINYHNELRNALAHYVVAFTDEKLSDELESDAGTKGFFSVKAWVDNLFHSRGTAGSETEKYSQYIFGFAGMWMMADEAHIINIAVREQYRRQGVGELLLIAMADVAREMNAKYLVLEVRATNFNAQNLYTKYGFKAVGIRKAYYTDNKEDAIMMSTGDITGEGFLHNLAELKSMHALKWGVDSYEILS